MPEMYQSLAGVYDRIQSIDTPAWADYIQQLEMKYSRRAGDGDGYEGRPLLLDLGCGTGSFCLEMLDRGYDPIGLDASPAMLGEAKDKLSRHDRTAAGGADCLFLQQDISNFQLYGTVDLMVCLLDTINHLTRISQVRRLFRLCRNYLNPGGLMIFDLATSRHLACSLGSELFYDDQPDYTLFWKNRYQPKTMISRSELVLFLNQPDGSYRRHDEVIVEKYYGSRQIRTWAAEAGLETAAHLGDMKMTPPAKADERTFYVLRRPLPAGAAQTSEKT